MKRLRYLSGVEAVTPKQSAGGGLRPSDAPAPASAIVADWTLRGGAGHPGLEKMGYTLLSGDAPTKSGDVVVGQFLAYNFKDTLRPDGYNMIDRWSGGWDPAASWPTCRPPISTP